MSHAAHIVVSDQRRIEAACAYHEVLPEQPHVRTDDMGSYDVARKAEELASAMAHVRVNGELPVRIVVDMTSGRCPEVPIEDHEVLWATSSFDWPAVALDGRFALIVFGVDSADRSGVAHVLGEFRLHHQVGEER